MNIIDISYLFIRPIKILHNVDEKEKPKNELCEVCGIFLSSKKTLQNNQANKHGICAKYSCAVADLGGGRVPGPSPLFQNP